MIRRPPRSTQSRSSAASDVYKRQTRLFYALRSRLVYGLKHFNRLEALLLILVTVLEVGPRLVRAIWRLSWSEFTATLSAYARLAWILPGLIRRCSDPPVSIPGGR